MTEGLIVLTGASGRIATLCRPILARKSFTVTLVDAAPLPGELHPRERFVRGSILDAALLDRALDGADCVIHLAALSSEQTWAAVSRVNIDGTHQVLEACRQHGIRNVLLASSNHAVGMTLVDALADIAEPVPRPDSFYGVTKATVEALGRMYADRFGMSVVSARIGTVLERPHELRHLSTWLSPEDFVRLVVAVLALREPGGHVVWGISDNTRAWTSAEAGKSIGFYPEDDAEAFASEVSASDGDRERSYERIGGPYSVVTPPVGGNG